MKQLNALPPPRVVGTAIGLGGKTSMISGRRNRDGRKFLGAIPSKATQCLPERFVFRLEEFVGCAAPIQLAQQCPNIRNRFPLDSLRNGSRHQLQRRNSPGLNSRRVMEYVFLQS